jgi:hypothetical protein
MLMWMRRKIGKTFISVIIGLIGFVFVFYGAFNPKALRGLHAGSIAGSVNGEPISLGDFDRQYRGMIRMFQKYSKEKVSEEMIKSMKIKKMAFDTLVRKKVLFQEAKKQDITASGQEVADTIAEYEDFQKNKVFDLPTYKKVLELNQLSAHRFEKTISEEIAPQAWEAFFEKTVKVSENEAKKEFQTKNHLVNLAFLVIPEAGFIKQKKEAAITQSQISLFFSSPENKKKAQDLYDQDKTTLYASQSFEQSQEGLARRLIQKDRQEKIRAELIELCTLNFGKPTQKIIEKKLQEFENMKITEKNHISAQSKSIGTISQPDKLLSDIFSKNPSLDVNLDFKRYEILGETIFARVTQREPAKMDQFEKEKTSFTENLQSQKAHTIYQAWLDQKIKEAKLEKNETILQD